MKKALTVTWLLLMAASVAVAQEASVAMGSKNSAADFSETSASQVRLLAMNPGESEAGDFALTNAPEASAIPGRAIPAEPAAKPRYIFGSRDDYRWQLGMGVGIFHFQSNVINATLVGLNTTLTYYTNSWFGLEGQVLTGFGPQINVNEHVKLVGGAGGIRIGGRRARWEPWGHALVGGSHLQPQTAGASRNSLMAEAGGGVDFRLHARLSFRLEGDWVYMEYFHQTQNNFQGVAGVVLHF